jgi:putative ABC transport system permease protein
VLRTAGLGEPPGTVRALESTLSADMGVIRLGATFLGLVALGAVVLTAVGAYGVVSSLVVHRTREFGVRLALGARRADVLRLVLTQGLRPVLAGVLVGAPTALALGRLLASRVHGLRPVEPALLAGTAFAFVAVVALACYLPARRATRVDPAVSLRYE